MWIMKMNIIAEKNMVMFQVHFGIDFILVKYSLLEICSHVK